MEIYAGIYLYFKDKFTTRSSPLGVKVAGALR
jgi:hypothetical protein